MSNYELQKFWIIDWSVCFMSYIHVIIKTNYDYVKHINISVFKFLTIFFFEAQPTHIHRKEKEML